MLAALMHILQHNNAVVLNIMSRVNVSSYNYLFTYLFTSVFIACLGEKFCPTNAYVASVMYKAAITASLLTRKPLALQAVNTTETYL